ncbi:MAG: radical SAM protein [Melioribacteraceae bacterium]|nr:radical SAM protein [Melioribacteraceae bacterium]MCF8264490.1 radical SAM protein [Melioribacteraceae bacterium]MCF8411923.1 radical SAM protein [Melioribacteraceae bacterium]MCF8430942.1 radical SAM protein [Melioribacteraceae bacterium]
MYSKFENETLTAKGEQRASVNLTDLKTLWFNSGTLCNLECKNCYIESTPRNDRLVYLSLTDVEPYLDEIEELKFGTELIGITGGEPFINPEIIEITKSILSRGFDLLILTNAYRVLNRHKSALLEIKAKYGNQLHLRVSLDHYTEKLHDDERGSGAFEGAMKGIKWLFDNGFNLSIAGRSFGLESKETSAINYQKALEDYDIFMNLAIGKNVVIFPEMIADEDVPEITVNCWGILNKKPEDQMCATERMIVKRKGAGKASVLSCTLIAYDEAFELGSTLKESQKEVFLNHPFCAKFCVLGESSCSAVR